MENKRKEVIFSIVLVVIALVSFLVLSGIFSSAKFHAGSISMLDDKKMTVATLSGAMALSATGIAALPGDATTPIANQVMQMSSYLIIVTCVILVEKYLLTITGLLSFKFLIPIACIIALIGIWRDKDMFKKLATKLTIFALAIFLVVPVSVSVTSVIEDTYQTSINEVIDNSQEFQDLANEEEDSNWFDDIVNQIASGVESITAKAEDVLSDFIDTVAVLIVTSCVIPILVLWAFMKIISIIFGMDIKLPEKNPIKNFKPFKAKNKI